MGWLFFSRQTTLRLGTQTRYAKDMSMTVHGYARVSTVDQDLSIQITALEAAGCDVVWLEKVSGTSRQGRAELDILLQFLRPEDMLVVTRVDRLARSIATF